MKFFDRVAVSTATTGTGTVTLGAVLDTNFFTFGEQGAADADQVYYMLNEGGDVEIGIGTIGGTVTTLSRDTVLSSRISGTASTSKMNLAGGAQVRCIAASEAFVISSLSSATVPLGGDEIIRVRQGGVDKQVEAKWLAADKPRNLLMNPLFQVDIEGNSGGKTVSGTHIVEGWRFLHATDVTTLTAARDAGTSLPHCLKMTVTTGSDASIGAGQYALFDTAVEGVDFAIAKWGSAAAKPIWVGGEITAPTTETYCVALQNAAATRSYVFEVACTADTPVPFLVEVPGDTSGTWSSAEGEIGIRMAVVAACGSTYQTTADAWAGGDYLCTSNQANALASNADVFKLEDPRMSVGGPISTEWINIDAALRRCLRYFETSYAKGTAPGSATFIGSRFAFANGTSRCRGEITYLAEKCKVVSPVLYSPYDSATSKAYNANSAANVSIGVLPGTPSTFGALVQGSESIGAGDQIQYHFMTNSRLL